MSFAVVHSRALRGLDAPAVTVEVHLANGLPSFTLVGLADTEVKEARERVRAALQNSGLEFPHNKRITVNLAPADLPKESGRFDLPIALGILAASGQIDAARLDGFEFAGELSLGRRAAPGARRAGDGLALQRARRADARAGAAAGQRATRRRWSTAWRCTAPRHLLDVVRALLPGEAADAAALRDARAAAAAVAAAALPDLRDVKGQAGAKRALEIAAAGGHSLLMVGPPGTGKSMLAQRFAGLLPPLTHDEALESAAVLSLAGALRARALGPARAARAAPQRLVGRRWSAAARRRGRARSRSPTTACCSSTSCPSSRAPRSRRCASRWRPAASSISRAARQAEFPARFQLVAAMNPCPCGHLGSPLRGLPLHARRGAALPGHASAGRCSTASTCRSRCRRSPPSCSPPRPTASRARAVARARRRGRERSRIARQGARNAAARRRRARRALPRSTPPRSRFLQAAADAARLVGAQLPPRAARRAHDRRPRRQRRRSRPPISAEAIQYRRVLQTH